MGIKFSVASTPKSSSSSINQDRSIPKYLKPSKHLAKNQRFEKKQHMVGVAMPYQPGNNNSNTVPPFVSIQMKSHLTFDLPSCHDNTKTENDGPKNAFQWFEGRRYQNQDDLLLPNDQRELDRLRVLNYILRWAFEGDIVAPVKEKLIQGAHVLNVGCGPGIWLGHPVIDFALDYKNSYFTAVDVLDLLPDNNIDYKQSTLHHHYQQGDNPSYFDFSPLHPMLPTMASCSTWHEQTRTNELTITDTLSTLSSIHSTPTRSIFDNLDLHTLDVREAGLPFMDNTFEFVMQRLSTPAYTSRQWNDVVGEMIRVTRPGGYLQFIEIDYRAEGLGPSGQAWQEKLCKAMEKTRKLDPFMANHIDTVLEQNGLVNVEKKKVSIPFGAWGLDIGILWQQNLEAFIEASAPALSTALGVSATECISMWQGYRDELNRVKAFCNVYAVWGQKPHSD
ncbi:hypothetical protein BC941DRAFT_478757 [Chlamydoabsidia padenii]|nr:hypothetical protein BC941DRAFT_478757 [Chlamydoabsidia padenii]